MEENTFGQVIKTARLKKGLSLRELARRIDVSHPYLSQLENGHNNSPSTQIILKLSESLGVSFVYLASLTNTDIGLKKDIPSHFVSILKIFDVEVIENMNTFSDFMDWVKTDEDYLNDPDKYDEATLKDLYESIKDMFLIERKTKALARLTTIQEDIYEKLDELDNDTRSLDRVLKGAMPVYVNGKELSELDIEKLARIAETIFNGE